MRFRVAFLMLGTALVAGACNSGPSLTQYAGELEVLITTMNSRLDEIDENLDNNEQTVERLQAYANHRMAARNTFMAAFEQLAPPDEAADLHDAALEALHNLVAAEQALADRVNTTTDLEGLSGLWDTPAGKAARAADEQAVAICRAAEEALNSTEERQVFVGLPWVPTELQEIVTVAFGCTAESG